MMHREHLILPRPNSPRGSPHGDDPGRAPAAQASFGSCTVGDSTFIVYASGSRVLVLTGDFELHQQFEPFADAAPLTALAVDSDRGWIAAASGSSVACFAPASGVPAEADAAVEPISVSALAEPGALEVEWRSAAVVAHPDTVTSIAWGSRGVLLVCSKTIALWTPSLAHPTQVFECEQSVHVIEPVSASQFSPDGSLFLTLAAGDTMPKIWYYRHRGVAAVISREGAAASVPQTGTTGSGSVGSEPSQQILDFVYLCHRQPVLSFEWRWSDSRDPNQNALLTVAADGICRIWSQFPRTSTGFVAFHMALALDPLDLKIPSSFSSPAIKSAPDLECSVSSCLSGCAHGACPASADSDTSLAQHHGASRSRAVVHWLTGSGLAATRALRTEREANFLLGPIRKPGEIVRTRSKRLADTLLDYPDMLFCVQPNGTLVIWGIQNLSSKPVRVPKLIVVMKTDQIIGVSDYEYFQGPMQIICDRFSLCNSAIYFPAELYILAQRQCDGVLSCFTLNLDDFFTGAWTTPRMRLAHMWSTHQQPIEHVVRHPCLPLLVSTDAAGQRAVHRSSHSRRGTRAAAGLQLVSTLWREHDAQTRGAMAWAPHAAVLFAAYGRAGTSAHQIIAIAVRDTQILHLATIVLPEAAQVGARFIHALHQPAVGEAPAVSYILAVTNDNTVLVWTADVTDTTVGSVALISQSMLPVLPGQEIAQLAAPSDLFAWQSPLCMPSTHVFTTLSTTGSVALWHCSDGSLSSGQNFDVSDKGLDWRCIASFDIGPGTLADVAALHAPERIATVHATGSNTWDLTVWSLSTSDLGTLPEWSATFTEPVVSLDWGLASDGQLLLAVALTSQIKVFVLERLASPADASQWVSVSQISMKHSDPAILAAWLPHGSLLVSSTRHVATFSKWVDADGPPTTVFSVAAEMSGRLPDHHPALLIHYLLWGRYDTVKYNLSLLNRFVTLCTEAGRELSEVPIPLWKLFSDGSSHAKTQAADALFSLDDALQGAAHAVGEFTGSDAENLARILSSRTLPRMSLADQQQLRAVIDTFAQLNQFDQTLDENGIRFVVFLKIFIHTSAAAAAAVASVAGSGSAQASSGIPGVMTTGARRSATARGASLEPAMSMRDVAWALFSDSQETLLEIAMQNMGGKLLWADARNIGFGLWVRNPETLKRHFELIARNQYLGREDTRDPVACAPFYIAMRKKNVLVGLWKLALSHPEQPAMLKFLANDFEEERWKNAALKNAFALLGKQRYEYAVAFFLLAGKLKDAISVCLKQLKDIQFAIVIARIYEGEDGPVLKELLEETLLPEAIAAGDRWLAAMLFYILRKYDSAIYATLMPLESLLSKPAEANAGATLPATTPKSDQNGIVAAPRHNTDPALLILYRHLRQAVKAIFTASPPQVTPQQEYELVRDAARVYDRLGCPGLALHVIESARLVEMPEVEVVSEKAAVHDAKVEPEAAPTTVAAATGDGIDWGEPVSKAPPSTASAFDWGEPAASSAAPAGGLDWGEMGTSSLLSTGGASGGGGGLDWGEMGSTIPKGDDDLDAELAAFERQLGLGGADAAVESEDAAETTEQAELAASAPGRGSQVLTLTPEAKLRLVLEKRGLRVYTWVLVMRICHAVYSSVTTVSDNIDILGKDAVFGDYVARLREGFAELSRMADIPLPVIDRIFYERCCEMNALSGYMEVVPLHGNVSDFTPVVSAFMAHEANALARIAFRTEFAARAADRNSYLMQASSRLLRSFVLWQNKAGTLTLDEGVVCQASVTVFVTVMLSSLELHQYNRIWWLVGMCDPLFDALLKGNKKSLCHLMQDLATDREPVAHPDDDADKHDNDDAELYDEFGLPRHRLGSPLVTTAELLVRVLVMRHVALTLEHYLERLKEQAASSTSMEDAHCFLTEFVLKALSRHIFDTQAALSSAWLGNGFQPENMKAYLVETQLKPLWALLWRTMDVKRMIQVISPAPPSPRASETQRSSEELVAAGQGADAAQPGVIGLAPSGMAGAGDSGSIASGSVASAPLAFAATSLHTRMSSADSTAQFMPEEPRPGREWSSRELSEVIYYASDMAHAIALNPLDANEMAVATSKCIRELDVQVSVKHWERRAGLGERQTSMDDLHLSPTSMSPTTPLGAAAVAAGDSVKMERAPSVSDLQKASMSQQRTMNMDLSQKLAKRAFSMHRLARDDTLVGASDGQKLKRKITGVMTMEAHRSFNFYLAGMSEGGESVVNLYQFGQPSELVSYTVPSDARLTKCHFDPFGVRFGASDSHGDLNMWRFDSSPSALRPALTLRQCHAGPISDFVFVNSTTTIATAGVSVNHMNVSVWDTLVPTSKSRVKSFQIGEAGISSLVFSAQHNMLIAGGKKGNIYIIDVRQGASLVNTFHAHNHVIRSLAIDPATDSLVSGSNGGEIKIWDLQALGNAEIASSARGTVRMAGGGAGGPWHASHMRLAGGGAHHGPGVVDVAVHGGIVHSTLSDGTVARMLVPLK